MQTPGRRREYRKEYYNRVKNEDWFKQRRKEQNARYRERHPYVSRKKEFKNSYSKEYRQKYYQEHREKILEQSRRRRYEKRRLKRKENMCSIILRDTNNWELFVAEVTTHWDIERIKNIIEELNKEYQEGTNEWDERNFIDELWYRTWLNIYSAGVLYF